MDEKKDIGYIPQEWSQKPGNSVGNENGNQNNGSADNEMRSGLMNNGEENSLRTDCGHPEYSTPGLSEKSPSGCENAYETKNNGNIPQPQEDPQNSEKLKNFINALLDENQEKLKNWLKDEIRSTKEELTNIQNERFRQFKDGITKLKDGLQSVINEELTTVRTGIGELEKSIVNQKSELGDGLREEIQSVKQDFETVKTVVTELKNEVQRVKEDLTNVQKSVVEAVKKDSETQNETFKQFGQSIDGLKNSIENQQRELKDKYEKENESLREKITGLEKGLKDAQNDIDKRKTEIGNLSEDLETEKQNGLKKQQTIDNLNEELETEKQNGQKKIRDLTVESDKFKKHYTSLEIHELEDAYNEFKNLNTKTKSTIDALFPQPSFIGFISAGMRLSNISSLWEMAKRNIFNNNLEDIEKLNKIFRILITVYNRGLKERQFELICPEIGSKYDSSTSAIKEMKSSGTVKEVLLIGYKNTADQNVHKAIISVNE